MLEHGPADEVEPVERVDERLACAGVALERPDVELRAGDGEVERLAVLGRERDVDHRGEVADLVAGEAVRAGLVVEGRDVGRDERVHGLGRLRGEEDVRGARVEDDVARLVEDLRRLPVDGDGGRGDDPVAVAGLVGVDEVAVELGVVNAADEQLGVADRVRGQEHTE